MPISCPFGDCASCPPPGVGGTLQEGVYLLSGITLFASGCGIFSEDTYRASLFVDGDRMDIAWIDKDGTETRSTWTFSIDGSTLDLRPTCGGSAGMTTRYSVSGNRLSIASLGFITYPPGDQLLFIRQ